MILFLKLYIITVMDTMHMHQYIKIDSGCNYLWGEREEAGLVRYKEASIICLIRYLTWQWAHGHLFYAWVGMCTHVCKHESGISQNSLESEKSKNILHHTKLL